MNITLNGRSEELKAHYTLKKIINQFCVDQRRVIAEVNGEVIKPVLWDNTAIKDGDTVELVNLVGGG